MKIKSIKKIGRGKVRNLTVNKNHTFITKNGIVTHNCDLASNRIMIIQSVLEGSGIYVKKINEQINPEPGFNVIATANSKGDGNADKYVGTNVLNEAFLDRFPMMIHQDYPTVATEKKILNLVSDDTDFISYLVEWASIIRSTFNQGGIDETVSTRRLVNILKIDQIFNNRKNSIEYAIARFDDETRESFYSLFDKITPESLLNQEEV